MVKTEIAGIIVGAVTLFVSIAALVSTIIIGKAQIRQSKETESKNEDRHNEMVQAEATKFIAKYSRGRAQHEAEIYLLPLCVAAYKYQPSYSYRREVYRDFCAATEEVQRNILERYGVEDPCVELDENACFFLEMVKTIRKIMAHLHRDSTDRIFYEGGKNFKRALEYHGEKLLPRLKTDLNEEYENSICDILKGESSYVGTGEDVEGVLIELNTDKGTAASEQTGIVMSVLACTVAKYCTSLYCCEDGDAENTKHDLAVAPEDFAGDWYMEDIFLDALYRVVLAYVKERNSQAEIE